MTRILTIEIYDCYDCPHVDKIDLNWCEKYEIPIDWGRIPEECELPVLVDGSSYAREVKK